MSLQTYNVRFGFILGLRANETSGISLISSLISCGVGETYWGISPSVLKGVSTATGTALGTLLVTLRGIANLLGSVGLVLSIFVLLSPQEIHFADPQTITFLRTFSKGITLTIIGDEGVGGGDDGEDIIKKTM